MKKRAYFVAPFVDSNKSPEENLGMAYLAEVCRHKNIDVTIIDGWLQDKDENSIIEEIISSKEVLFVGFSANLLTGDAVLRIAKQCRPFLKDTIFIAGGFGPTLNPIKYLNDGFDFVSYGEGEGTFSDLCDCLLAGEREKLRNITGLGYLNIKNEIVYQPREVIQNLDTLPFPARDTMDAVISRQIPVNISTSRGCMGNCSFCSISAFWKKQTDCKWRGRSISNIIDEIEQLYNRNVRYIKIVDDSFIEGERDEKWCAKFADELIRRGINVRFRITMRVSKITDEIVRQLYRAGCDSLVIGVENFSEEALKRMRKCSTKEKNINALEILKHYPIYVLYGFILFDNNTTLRELRENYVYLQKYNWGIIKGIFSEMYAAEGTDFTQRLKKEGKIKRIAFFEDYPYDIEDHQARLVYKYLKTWNRKHTKLYDILIEPINKPRILSREAVSKLYDLYRC